LELGSAHHPMQCNASLPRQERRRRSEAKGVYPVPEVVSVVGFLGCSWVGWGDLVYFDVDGMTDGFGLLLGECVVHHWEFGQMDAIMLIGKRMRLNKTR